VGIVLKIGFASPFLDQPVGTRILLRRLRDGYPVEGLTWSCPSNCQILWMRMACSHAFGAGFCSQSSISSAHLQKDTVVHVQHMVLSLSMGVPGGLWVHSLSESSLKLCTYKPPGTLIESEDFSPHSSCVPTSHQELS
jgi:hypothetical protein